MNNSILVATQSGTLNVNIDQKTLDMCIKEVPRFVDTIYQNICNGQSVIVPTGSFTWFLFICGCTFFFVILGFMVVGLIKFALDM